MISLLFLENTMRWDISEANAIPDTHPARFSHFLQPSSYPLTYLFENMIIGLFVLYVTK